MGDAGRSKEDGRILLFPGFAETAIENGIEVKLLPIAGGLAVFFNRAGGGNATGDFSNPFLKPFWRIYAHAWKPP